MLLKTEKPPEKIYYFKEEIYEKGKDGHYVDDKLITGSRLLAIIHIATSAHFFVSEALTVPVAAMGNAPAKYSGKATIISHTISPPADIIAIF